MIGQERREIPKGHLTSMKYLVAVVFIHFITVVLSVEHNCLASNDKRYSNTRTFKMFPVA